MPSSLSSHIYSTSVRPLSSCTRRSQERNSFSLYVLSSESMGEEWRTLTKPSRGFPPTRWVGESGVIRSGCSVSSFLSWSISLSNSASLISGSSST